MFNPEKITLRVIFWDKSAYIVQGYIYLLKSYVMGGYAMNNYDKRIVYFDLVEEDRRIGNGGFVKLIVQNGQLRLTINTSGLHKTTKDTEILFNKSNEIVAVDTIYIKEGKSVYSRLFVEKELKEKGISLQDVYAITIPLNDKRRLLAIIKQPQKESVVKETREAFEVREEPAK